ncbi:uncharacterized protein EV420DRAFT_1545113 [Desarmillaria tabescens]|uniref:Uncharacterized protein n=1 Tax=Armillaria tabescens TaxID=1929756 RepID=A0AA39KC20_ARMTA|nr:uncharacterized protein EV420DRAFT_1545113 [Desarmillaria tabescens]KAK0458350.1 hypothetical protein EV420DRAFT_1545113 [Desarmillaria tabescens]
MSLLKQIELAYSTELSALVVVVLLTECAHAAAFTQGLSEISDRFTVLHRLTLKGIKAVDPASVTHARDAQPSIVVRW